MVYGPSHFGPSFPWFSFLLASIPWLESFVLDLLVVIGFHPLLVFGFLYCRLISGFL
ncbi:hypothetical protein Hanom_Chr02g00147011 [Helianthus anomalus]